MNEAADRAPDLRGFGAVAADDVASASGRGLRDFRREGRALGGWDSTLSFCTRPSISRCRPFLIGRSVELFRRRAIRRGAAESLPANEAA